MSAGCEYVPKNISQNVNKLIKGNTNSKIIIFGFSFKENCSDIRNTKIFKIYKILKNKYKLVDVYDPIVNFDDVKSNYNFNMQTKLKNNFYDLAIIAVKHDIFKSKGKVKIKKVLKRPKIIYDYISLFN